MQTNKHNHWKDMKEKEMCVFILQTNQKRDAFDWLEGPLEVQFNLSHVTCVVTRDF